ncbi:MAG: hypothetical protein EOM25_03920 [Deltaproteobacteria bacterium]|nr:hypothetical protein [Deltaproteobacteria bacterium]
MYTVAPLTIDAPAGAGDFTVNVDTSAGCVWTASASAGWLSLGGSGGTGPGSVVVSVSENTAAQPRTAAVSVADKSVVVNQVGACTYDVQPRSASFDYEGDDGHLQVTTSVGTCEWTATSPVDWIVVATPSGIGSGTVAYTVLANAGDEDRSAVLTVAGIEVHVVQGGVNPCTFTVTPLTASVDVAGGQVAVTVTASVEDCAWTASSQSDWLTVTQGQSGQGSGTVVLTAAPNVGVARNGQAVVAGETVSVNQDGQGPCAYTLQPTGANMVAEGGDGTVTVTASRPDCQWTAASEVRWITILSGAQGTGSGQVAYRVDPNDLDQIRTGTMTVVDQTFTVIQEASAPQCTFTIDPTELTFEAGGGNGTVQITASHEDCSWAAVSAAEWVRIVEPSSGEGSGRIGFMVEANQGRERRTSLTVAGRIVSIVQSGTGSGSSSSGGGCIYDPKAKEQGLGWLLLLLVVAGISVASRLRVK